MASFNKKIYLSFLLILVASFSAKASTLACSELFNPLAADVIDAPSRFLIRSLIPKDFLDVVEKVLGSVTMNIEKFPGFKANSNAKSNVFSDAKDLDRANEKNYTSIRIEITAGQKIPFVYFQMSFANQTPHRVIISFLKMTNPLTSEHSGPDLLSLHQTQDTKGIPYPVLAEIRRRLFGYLFSKGIRSMTVPGVTDYTVSLLYRRLMGFVPANPRSVEIYQALDKAFQNARKLPPGLRPRSVDEFSRSLLHVHADELAFLSVNLQLSVFLKNGQLMPTTRMINDGNGNLLALVENYGLDRQRIYYIDPKSKRLLFWRELTKDLGTELTLDLVE